MSWQFPLKWQTHHQVGVGGRASVELVWFVGCVDTVKRLQVVGMATVIAVGMESWDSDSWKSCNRSLVIVVACIGHNRKVFYLND